MKKQKEILGLNENTIKILLTKSYVILVDDPEHLGNINRQCFECFALSYHEAIGKMYIERPEFIKREILNISETELLPNSETVQVYVSKTHKRLVKNALETLEKRRN